jgi:predicted nucleic acid-binding protein
LIVVDASAVLELVLRTEKGKKVEARALVSEESLHAPHLIDVEVTQALRRLVQLKEIKAERAKQALDDHAALHIKRADHEDMLERLWELRESVTAYDATYVALAEALDAPLITCDSKLTRSHGHRATVELIE